MGCLGHVARRWSIRFSVARVYESDEAINSLGWTSNQANYLDVYDSIGVVATSVSTLAAVPVTVLAGIFIFIVDPNVSAAWVDDIKTEATKAWNGDTSLIWSKQIEEQDGTPRSGQLSAPGISDLHTGLKPVSTVTQLLHLSQHYGSRPYPALPTSRKLLTLLPYDLEAVASALKGKVVAHVSYPNIGAAPGRAYMMR